MCAEKEKSFSKCFIEKEKARDSVFAEGFDREWLSIQERERVRKGDLRVLEDCGNLEELVMHVARIW